MLNGNILDVYLDYKKNRMITWLINSSGAFKVEDFYQPSFYVYANIQSLYHLRSILQGLPQVEKLGFVSAKLELASDRKKTVLEVTPKKIGDLSKLANMVDLWGDFYRNQLFDVDIRMPTRYLQSKGVFCNAWVKWNGQGFICDEEQWSIEYETPFYRVAHFDLEQKTKKQIISFNEPIEKITVDDQVFREENEADTILSAVKQVQKVDPDIVYTVKGDSVLLPLLYHRADRCGIKHKINLGRDSSHRLNPAKQAKSYFSYGQIVFRPAFYTFFGRVHIDTYNSFMYGESGLRGIIDISRCSNIPLQLLSRLGPGTAISQMQVNKVMEKGFLVPWKKNLPENWKTGLDLLNSDRGGLILEPDVGLHQDVFEFDFASLYPSIMLKFNISPETMLCSCCPNSPIYVPQLGYNICNKRFGLVPEVLKPIIYRRFCFKARSKNSNYDRGLYGEMQKAWKWILLVCFGYTGYRNARYGRIECHESITAFSRDVLLSAIKTAEQSGYGVLHGIIDSLWLKPKKPKVTPFYLSRLISKKAGLKMDVEGHYKWIVFLPCKQFEVGALNRYYGVFDDGTLKIRGIELRQRNTPEFIREIQRDMLEILSRADTSEEFMRSIPLAVEIIKNYAKKIIRKEVETKKLVIKSRVSRDVSSYQVNTLVKAALMQIRDTGVQVEAGQSIRYVVKDELSRDYKKRVIIAEKIRDDESYDVDFYLRQIAKSGESILIPFDYDIDKFKRIIERVKNRERMNVSVLPRVRTD